MDGSASRTLDEPMWMTLDDGASERLAGQDTSLAVIADASYSRMKLCCSTVCGMTV